MPSLNPVGESSFALSLLLKVAGNLWGSLQLSGCSVTLLSYGTLPLWLSSHKDTSYVT